MRDNERRKLDKFERELAFMIDNAPDFTASTPGAIATAEHTAIVAEMRALFAQQVSEGAEAAQAYSNKEDAFDDLISTVRNMNLAANAFEDEVPGSDELFRMPRPQTQQNVLASARAYHSDSGPPLQIKFVEYGLAATFRDDLQDSIDAYEAASSAADTSEIQKAAATAGLIDAGRRGTANSKKLNAIIRIKYDNNPQKLGAWTVASHLERAPKSNTPATPPTP